VASFELTTFNDRPKSPILININCIYNITKSTRP
jgi:hypothetical protein